MTRRDTCRLPSCDRDPGSADTAKTYRDTRFCSPGHDLKYEHLKADARETRRDAQPDPEPAPGRRP